MDSTLDKLEALQPTAVIAGHKVPQNADDPRIIGETRQYLRNFNRLNEATTTARQLYDVGSKSDDATRRAIYNAERALAGQENLPVTDAVSASSYFFWVTSVILT